jgi:hypothetical protein
MRREVDPARQPAAIRRHLTITSPVYVATIHAPDAEGGLRVHPLAAKALGLPVEEHGSSFPSPKKGEGSVDSSDQFEDLLSQDPPPDYTSDSDSSKWSFMESRENIQLLQQCNPQQGNLRNRMSFGPHGR